MCKTVSLFKPNMTFWIRDNYYLIADGFFSYLFRNFVFEKKSGIEKQFILQPIKPFMTLFEWNSSQRYNDTIFYCIFLCIIYPLPSLLKSSSNVFSCSENSRSWQVCWHLFQFHDHPKKKKKIQVHWLEPIYTTCRSIIFLLSYCFFFSVLLSKNFLFMQLKIAACHRRHDDTMGTQGQHTKSRTTEWAEKCYSKM